MAMTIEGRYARSPFRSAASSRPSPRLGKRKAYTRLAGYLRGLPDDVMCKLGVSPGDVEKLRHCGEAPPPGLYGRVSVVSVLRSSRY